MDTTMHELDDTNMSQFEIDRLRDLRATTMLRLAANRIHVNYVHGTLDEGTLQDVDQAVAELTRLGGEIAHDRSARIVSGSVGRLADALDADDHVAGQREITLSAPTMVAMALISGWEVGALDPF
jgi:hypothetical protein